jgi:hypothetical protein
VGKYLLLSLLILTALPALAVCPNKINPSKVMLFVDANFGDPEIAAAEKAACKRGERLEVVPKAWKQYTSYQKATEVAITALTACTTKYPNAQRSMWGSNGNKTKTECDVQMQAYQAASTKMREFTSKQKPVPEQLKERMEELSKEKTKVKLTNVSISGHDGGGHFGGQKGDISRDEVAKIMAEFPEMNDVQSLLLLGCYTGVQNEVAAWKGIFPKVKIIGGYDGSAPASSRVQGHNYITNILTKEKALLALKNKTNIDQDVKRMIGNLGELNSAVYIDLACKEEDDEFYYASKLDRKFNKLNLNDCQKALVELEKFKPYYNQLYSGEIEPPTETSAGETRKLYDKIRTNEHCLNSDDMFGSNSMNSNGAFNLLFWHGVKKNFAKFYDKDMKEAEAMLSDVNPQEMMDELTAQMEAIEKEKKIILDQIEEYQKDPDAYKAKIETELKAAKALAEEAAKDPAYRALMQRMYSATFNSFTPEEKALMEKVNKLNTAVFNKEHESYNLRASPAQFVEMKKSSISHMDASINYQKQQMTQIPANIEKLKKIWIPTQANMENKTRKEVMENLHAINGLMSAGSLPQKKYMALSYVNSVASSHLQYLQNPFSWHEYTGNPEKPPYVQTLSGFMSSGSGMYSSSGYGMSGMGGMGGGGYVGGAQSGSNGGAGLNEGDRPAH